MIFYTGHRKFLKVVECLELSHYLRCVESNPVFTSRNNKSFDHSINNISSAENFTLITSEKQFFVRTEDFCADIKISRFKLCMYFNVSIVREKCRIIT